MDIFIREQININLQYAYNKTLFQKCNSCSCVLLIHFEMVNTRGQRMTRYCWTYAAFWRLKADTQGDAVFTLTSKTAPCSTFLFYGFLWKNTETVLQDVCIEICQGVWHNALNSCSKVTVSNAKCLIICMTEKLILPWNASTAVLLKRISGVSPVCDLWVEEDKLQDTCYRDPGKSEFTEAVETGIPS